MVICDGLSRTFKSHFDATTADTPNWSSMAEQEIRNEGMAGKLCGAIINAANGALVDLSMTQWESVELDYTPRPRRAILWADGQFLDVTFDPRQVRRIWPGKRGARSTLEAYVDGFGPDPSSSRDDPEPKQPAVPTPAAPQDALRRYRLTQLHKRKSLEQDIYSAIKAGPIPTHPLQRLKDLAEKYDIGPDTALRARRDAISRAIADGLPAAPSWGRRGRKPGRRNPPQ